MQKLDARMLKKMRANCRRLLDLLLALLAMDAPAHWAEAAMQPVTVPPSASPRRLRSALKPHIAFAFGPKKERQEHMKCWHKCHSKCSLKCSRYAMWPNCQRGTESCHKKLVKHSNAFEGCVKRACKECYVWCKVFGDGVAPPPASPDHVSAHP